MVQLIISKIFKMKKFLRLSSLALIAILSLSLNSCKSDDEPSSNKDSSFSVNGTKISNILYTLCEISSSPKEMALEAHFRYDDTTYSLDMAIPSIRSLDDIDPGDKFDADDFEIYKFYPMSGAYVGSQDYEPISGKATVKSISSKALVIEFSNFKFLRELGSKEDTFTINGSISYSINN